LETSKKRRLPTSAPTTGKNAVFTYRGWAKSHLSERNREVSDLTSEGFLAGEYRKERGCQPALANGTSKRGTFKKEERVNKKN